MQHLLLSLECGLSLLDQIQYILVQGISWLSKNALIIIRCFSLDIKLLVRSESDENGAGLKPA